MYPLRFEPLFQRYLWGGRKLSEVLSKPIGNQPAAESWELVDHQDGQSIVLAGQHQGKSLHEMVVQYQADLVGQHVWERINQANLPASLQQRFPLLFKFLDANRHLSVQVHPDDAMGRTLSPPDLGKTEAWYVIHAEPGSKIYAGLREGVTADQFRQAIDQGTTDSLLHCFEPAAGDCIFVQTGTLHAIGAGLLVAEIQQASNTTFRVFDWNRVDDQGNPRPLHIEQAMEATDFQRGPVAVRLPVEIDDLRQQLVSCKQFEMNRIRASENFELGGDRQFRFLACLSGSLSLENDPLAEPLTQGQTALLPACLGSTNVVVHEPVELLEVLSPR